VSVRGTRYSFSKKFPKRLTVFVRRFFYFQKYENEGCKLMKTSSQPKNNMLHILIVEPGKAPRPACVENKITALQELVGGELEVILLSSNSTALICNRYGKEKGLTPNRKIPGGYIAGTFFIASLGEGRFVSLPLSARKIYGRRFARPDNFLLLGGEVFGSPKEAIPAVYKFWQSLRAGEVAALMKLAAAGGV
jgi:hypothetical protein